LNEALPAGIALSCDEVIMEMVGNELHVRPVDDVLARVQSRLKPFVPEGVRLSDELIASRRKAAEDE
jgi:hypothetical protein